MEEKKVLLSVRNLNVKFRVRGRVLTAIRNVSLDIYEGESIAIVGESGCGKSVLTKTFSGMLDNNGFIDQGDIIFNDEDLSKTKAPKNTVAKIIMARAKACLDKFSRLELGAATFREIASIEKERKRRAALTEKEVNALTEEKRKLQIRLSDAGRKKRGLVGTGEWKAQIETFCEIARLKKQLKNHQRKWQRLNRRRAREARADTAYLRETNEKLRILRSKYQAECAGEVPGTALERNIILAKEIYLSISRYPIYRWAKLFHAAMNAFRDAMKIGVDLSDDVQLDHVFETALFRVQYKSETEDAVYGTSILNLAKNGCINDWTVIRGNKVATIFQDPMTSLNPIIPIGKQIASVIIMHQKVSEAEARRRAIELMQKVGIPNAEYRFDDYPFQYSGGMRQRIVIAIALSCQPKILICDEPTTALDVTIQAQILQLIKDLQKEFRYTVVFITHDLGVVANIADRVAVLYAGQIVEIGTVEEVFYDPRHPYTWVLLSSLPQLVERNTELYSIAGTPPSLYDKVAGDAFAPRNPYCLRVDTIREPPMFRVTDTHYAKTWLLDPRAPKIEKPEIIRDIPGTLRKIFNI